jgi:hypothetical protein
LEEGDIEAINRDQRIVLLAEEFDYEVLVTAEWLTERYDLDVRCYRVALAKHGDVDLLTCTRAYPPPELTDIAIRRRRKKDIGAQEPGDWEDALRGIENQAVINFVRKELAEGQPNNPKYKAVRFFIGGRRRFVVYAKRKWARVWQSARFEDDIEFWKSRLGKDREIKPSASGRRLRFNLVEEADFTKFKRAVTVELSNTEFHGAAEDEPRRSRGSCSRMRTKITRKEARSRGQSCIIRTSGASEAIAPIGLSATENAESAVVRISARANRLGLYR